LWGRLGYKVKLALDGAHAESSIAAMPDTTLDLRGLRCPLPALKTRKALTRLAAGDRLVVECTDPLSTLDIPNLINQTGDVLEDSSAEPGLFVFRIRKHGA
jgi:tRNA 2-thiouridine synthesizing protein A